MAGDWDKLKLRNPLWLFRGGGSKVATEQQRGCTLKRRHPDCWEHGCEGYEPCEVLERMKAKASVE
jgi:hypothetical protein